MATAIAVDVETTDEGWKRMVSLMVVVQLLTMMGLSVITSFLPLFIQTIGGGSKDHASFWAGVIYFCQAIMVAIFSPIWGSMADRLGTKVMVIRALLGCGVIYGAASWVGHVAYLIPLFMLAGMFSGISTAIVTLVSASVPKAKLGAAIGACQTGQFVGIAIGPLVGGVLADTFSYRIGMRSGAVLVFIAVAIVLFGIREPARRADVSNRRPGVMAGVRQASVNPALLLLVGLIFLIQFANGMINPVLPVYIQHLVHNDDRTATMVGIVLAVGGVGSAIGAFMSGRGADRIGRHRMLFWATAGSGIMIMLQSLFARVFPLAALRGGEGMFTGGLNAGANASIGTIATPETRGAAFGVAGSAFSLGNAFGPLLGGALAGLFTPRIVIFLAGVVMLGGHVLVHRLGRYEPEPEPTLELAAES